MPTKKYFRVFWFALWTNQSVNVKALLLFHFSVLKKNLLGRDLVRWERGRSYP